MPLSSPVLGAVGPKLDTLKNLAGKFSRTETGQTQRAHREREEMRKLREETQVSVGVRAFACVSTAFGLCVNHA